jgi:hypothetical protein
MSREEIAATVNTITGLIGALTYAPAADKAEIYAGLRLRLTLQPGQPGPQNGDHASRNRPGMYEKGWGCRSSAHRPDEHRPISGGEDCTSGRPATDCADGAVGARSV